MTPLLDARDITASMPADTGTVRVLDGVSLAVAAGELVDVVGPSGSGKTTLLRALARLLPGAGGALFLDSVPAEQIAPGSWRAQVALLPAEACHRRGRRSGQPAAAVVAARSAWAAAALRLRADRGTGAHRPGRHHAGPRRFSAFGRAGRAHRAHAGASDGTARTAARRARCGARPGIIGRGHRAHA